MKSKQTVRKKKDMTRVKTFMINLLEVTDTKVIDKTVNTWLEKKQHKIRKL